MISLKNQLIRLGKAAFLLLVLIISLDYSGLLDSILPQGIYGIYIFMTLVSLLLTIGGHAVMRHTEQATWTSLFLGMMVARLLLTAGYVGLMLYLGLENKLLWVICLFVIYLFYMVFEIAGLITNLRAISEEAD
jgi:hypothetical protein